MSEEDPIDLINQTIMGERDRQRPELEDVARVIWKEISRMVESGDVDFVQTVDGPDQWIWEDLGCKRLGIEKVLVLTGSHRPGMEGFPTLTVRTTMAPQLEIGVSTSATIIGLTDDDIALSAGMSLAHHDAARVALRDSISVSVIAKHPELGTTTDPKDVLEYVNGLYDKREMN